MTNPVMKRRDFAKGLLLAPAMFLDGKIIVPRTQQLPRVNAARLNANLTALAQFGRNDKGGITRVAYSNADREAREFVMGLMRAVPLDVRIDTAGNIIGRLIGRDPSRPVLMTGSHIDSVPEGGNFDGQVGSIAAIEMAQTLADARMQLPETLEVVIFQNEENGKIGSKAMRGQDPATYLDLQTHSGKTVREGIRFIGGDPDRVLESRRAAGSIKACVELHIEQGDVLHSTSTQIGIVEGIVGIKRWQVIVAGFANHAGTTPMDRRQDALLAAAQFIHAVNRIVRAHSGPAVATVGSIAVTPGAPNVIPGSATVSLEIRDLQMSVIDLLFASIRAESGSIATATGTTFSFNENYRTEPAVADNRAMEVIQAAARSLGLSLRHMPSGAGHDAQEIATLAPMGMIFVPSRDGISHSAEEYTSPAQIAAGADVLLRTLLSL